MIMIRTQDKFSYNNISWCHYIRTSCCSCLEYEYEVSKCDSLVTKGMEASYSGGVVRTSYKKYYPGNKGVV